MKNIATTAVMVIAIWMATAVAAVLTAATTTTTTAKLL